MAEYSNDTVQTVAAGSNVAFTNTPVKSCKCITHRDGSGLIMVRPCNGCAMYQATFSANIAAIGTAAPISLAIAIDGEALTSATGTVTPAAAGDFNNVAVSAMISVPCDCCVTVSVKNPGADAISVSNPNLIISKVN